MVQLLEMGPLDLVLRVVWHVVSGRHDVVDETSHALQDCRVGYRLRGDGGWSVRPGTAGRLRGHVRNVHDHLNAENDRISAKRACEWNCVEMQRLQKHKGCGIENARTKVQKKGEKNRISNDFWRNLSRFVDDCGTIVHKMQDNSNFDGLTLFSQLNIISSSVLRHFTLRALTICDVSWIYCLFDEKSFCC